MTDNDEGELICRPTDMPGLLDCEVRDLDGGFVEALPELTVGQVRDVAGKRHLRLTLSGVGSKSDG